MTLSFDLLSWKFDNKCHDDHNQKIENQQFIELLSNIGLPTLKYKAAIRGYPAGLEVIKLSHAQLK